MEAGQRERTTVFIFNFLSLGLFILFGNKQWVWKPVQSGVKGKERENKIAFLFSCLPKLWTWNTRGEIFFFLHTYQMNQMGLWPALLYFWSCLWFSPHGHAPSVWWTNNEGEMLFIAWREHKRSFLITVLGNIQSILWFALKYFIMLPCCQQPWQEAFFIRVVHPSYSRERNISGGNFITSVAVRCPVGLKDKREFEFGGSR